MRRVRALDRGCPLLAHLLHLPLQVFCLVLFDREGTLGGGQLGGQLLRVHTTAVSWLTPKWGKQPKDPIAALLLFGRLQSTVKVVVWCA